MFERLIKRTIWEAKCSTCEWQDVQTANPPKERLCPHCKEWVTYIEQTAIGPDLILENK
jgi:hypothetical protein